MKTFQILTLPEADVAPKINELKIKELDRHIDNILQKFGIADARPIISAVIKAMPQSGSGREGFAQILELLHSHPALQQEIDLKREEVIKRLAILITVIISKKYQKIEKENRNYNLDV